MFYGKNIFSWNVPDYMSGDPIKFAQGLHDANFDGVFLKAGDGYLIHRPASWSPWPKWGVNIKIELVRALKDAGLKVYLWHFLYGYNSKGERDTAISQIDKFEPDGYIWDVEGDFDSKVNSGENATLVGSSIRSRFPDLPQALCWWALPKNPANHDMEWHPIAVARAFLPYIDVGMPMMYWGGNTAGAAYSYLVKSLNLWRMYISNTLPIIPIGRAYTGDGGIASAEAVIEFANRVYLMKESHNLPGVAWWVLDHAAKLNKVWEALQTTPKYHKETGKLSNEEILKRLINEHRDIFPELF